MKVAINGFGRIGRLTLRKILERGNLEVVAINDLGDPNILAHLFEYDTTYGKYGEDVLYNGTLNIGERSIKVLNEKDPLNLPWSDLGVDLVIECTGAFRTKEGAGKHITAGAKKVVLSAPAKSDDINTYLMGVNSDEYDGEDIVSMGSCTTNCLAPICKILDEEIGIEKGYLTTIHSYTNDQRILDLEHKDLRRARCAGMNMIPTTTGATKSVEKCLPNLVGKLDGMAVRVPTSTVSLIDFVVELKKETTEDEINELLRRHESNILKVSDEPLVSSDYSGSEYSSIIDGLSTKSFGKMVKIIAWYDNEWGYSTRLAEFSELILK